jgi:hypothetical protein
MIFSRIYMRFELLPSKAWPATKRFSCMGATGIFVYSLAVERGFSFDGVPRGRPAGC